MEGGVKRIAVAWPLPPANAKKRQTYRSNWSPGRRRVLKATALPDEATTSDSWAFCKCACAASNAEAWLLIPLLLMPLLPLLLLLLLLCMFTMW